MGLALIKADASVNFKQIVTVRNLDSNGNPIYSQYNAARP
jgi:hypothetical protein